MGDKVSEIRTEVDLVDHCSDLKAVNFALAKKRSCFITVGLIS